MPDPATEPMQCVDGNCDSHADVIVDWQGADPGRQPEQAIPFAPTDHAGPEALPVAAPAFLDKVDSLEPHIASTEAMSQNHGGSPPETNWAEEREALRDTLAAQGHPYIYTCPRCFRFTYSLDDHVCPTADEETAHEPE